MNAIRWTLILLAISVMTFDRLQLGFHRMAREWRQ